MADFKFLYLHDYIIEKKGKKVGKNSFNLRTEQDIQKAEKILGRSFPNELRAFYKEIGCGTLWQSFDENPDTTFREGNTILPPLAAANFSKGILFWENQMHYMAEDFYEDLQPGDLPFFELHSSLYFFVMKLNSNNPNAVWDGNKKICNSFEEFIYRLYYESPIFYEQYF